MVCYLRRRIASGEVLGEEPLDLPPRELRTRAVWYLVPPELLERAGIAEADVPGAVHAAEHAAIGLLPLWATCDRWDIGGVSTALHADTGATTVFVYDGAPGRRRASPSGASSAWTGWLAATKTRSPPASAPPAARRACSRPSAATATSRWTRPARRDC